MRRFSPPVLIERDNLEPEGAPAWSHAPSLLSCRWWWLVAFDLDFIEPSEAASFRE